MTEKKDEVEQKLSFQAEVSRLLDIVANSPHYSQIIGFIICIGFAFLLGFGSTLAEPALNALGLTVQELTNGAFKKSISILEINVRCGVVTCLIYS